MPVTTQVTYTGNGSQYTYAVPFEYLSHSHVHVYLNDVETFDFAWLNTYNIGLRNIPASGVRVLIRRVTPFDSQTVVWQDGSVIQANDMNAADLQTLFVLQENMTMLTYLNSRLETFDSAIATVEALIQTTAERLAAFDIHVADVSRQLTETVAATITQANADIDSKVTQVNDDIDRKVTQVNSTFDARLAAARTEMEQNVASAHNWADASAVLADVAARASREFVGVMQSYSGLYTQISIVDGGSSSSYVDIEVIKDGGDSLTNITIAAVSDGPTSHASTWYVIDPVVLQALNPKGIQSISEIDENGEITITVSNTI